MNNVAINSGSTSHKAMEQTTFQLIPKEYVRAMRQLHQQKLEQERAARPFWKKIFGI